MIRMNVYVHYSSIKHHEKSLENHVGKTKQYQYNMKIPLKPIEKKNQRKTP
jgi:hypothetical protein